MRFDRLFTKLFCRPVLLESATRVGFELALLQLMEGGSFEHAGAFVHSPDDHRRAVAEFQGQTDLERVSFRSRKIGPERAQQRADSLLEMRAKDTALIHIDGSIDKNLSSLDRISIDATDLRDVDNALATAANDPAIRNVLLVIDSPGGSVTGVPETGARIAALAQQKNVFAFTEGLCCSAAMWLAACADQIFSTSSAQMGSVGVYLALLDQTTALANRGMKIETIKSGKLKAAGASWKTLTDDERAHLQAQVDQIGATFRAAVNAKRPQVSDETMQGQSFFGDRNADEGLTDGIVSGLDEALGQF